MDGVRTGRILRALRRRRGWTQAQLAAKAHVSQTAISRIERGGGDRLTVQRLAKVAGALGARLRVELSADGENLARLLDADHAALVERVAQLLAEHGWEVWPEATFAVFGERGSIDILAFHAPTGSLLVIEVKSVLPDVQATLAGIDRKRRLAVQVAAQRGWQVKTVSRWLVLAETTTARDRLERHRSTFAAALPMRTVELRRWARRPQGSVAGILFVRLGPQVGRRHRTRTQAAPESRNSTRAGSPEARTAQHGSIHPGAVA